MSSAVTNSFKTKAAVKKRFLDPSLTGIIFLALAIITGIIAQEVESVFPECIKTSDHGVKTVNNDPITWALVNAVKELSARVKELESRQ